MDISQILKERFGHNSFRGKQEEIITSVMEGSDALVIMPTGGGKSLCYQIPALAQEGMTVVISPLIALMTDQVAALRQLNISAATLHSNIDDIESRQIFEEISNQNLKLLYVSPERLLSDGFMSFLGRQKINLFAIDEAHCVSIWGNDFRPEYVKLSRIKTSYPETPVIALTATADPATQKDIIQQLNLDVDKAITQSFERKNIFIDVRPGTKRIDQIVKFIKDKKGEAGIVYCLSRKSTEKVAEKLQSEGINAAHYHAGVKAEKRKATQTAFQSDNIDVVCATIAFGMGIDKPNIRYVIHYNMPKNVEGYYQEIGRSGRDGHNADALLFASWGDLLNLQKFIDDSEANDTFKKVQTAKLQRMWEFASATSCRTNLILNYFGEFTTQPCGHCDNCVHPPQLFDGTQYTQMALSAVIRSEGKVGINTLIEILKGTYSPEVKAAGYDQIKTFGVGREVPFTHWKHYITQMINQGWVMIDYSDRFRLKPTPISNDVLRNGTEVRLGEYVPPKSKKKEKQKSLALDTDQADTYILDALKSWRREKATSQKVPPYVILHDKALLQIATLLPKQQEELLQIDGIGKVKLERYGEDIIDVVQKS